MRLPTAYLRIGAQQTAGRQPRTQYSQSPTSGPDVETTNRWRRESQELLAAGRQNPLGQSFTVAGRTFTRVDRLHALAGNIWARDPDAGELVLLNRAEEHAFWAWAVIEVLRHNGIPVEELLELTHHNLVQQPAAEAHPAALFTATLTANARCRRHHRPRVEGALKSVHTRHRSHRTRWLPLI